MGFITNGGGGGGGGAISGVTVTGTAASGDVPVASSSSAGVWAFPPGYEIGYDQITANVTVSSSTEATPTAIISCAAHTFDGTAVLLQVFIPSNQVAAAAGAEIVVVLFEATTELGRLGTFGGTTGVNGQGYYGYRFTPSAASHTYTISGYQASGNATVNAGAAGTAAYLPAFARFTKV